MVELAQTKKREQKLSLESPPHHTIQPLETDNVVYRATDLQRFRDGSGKETIFFNLSKDDQPFIPENSNEFIVWNFWVKPRKGRQDFQLGLDEANQPTISYVSSGEELEVFPCYSFFLDDWIRRGELVPIEEAG